MSQALEQGQYEKDSNLTKKKLVLNLLHFFTRLCGGQKKRGKFKAASFFVKAELFLYCHSSRRQSGLNCEINSSFLACGRSKFAVS